MHITMYIHYKIIKKYNLTKKYFIMLIFLDQKERTYFSSLTFTYGFCK